MKYKDIISGRLLNLSGQPLGVFKIPFSAYTTLCIFIKSVNVCGLESIFSAKMKYQQLFAPQVKFIDRFCSNLHRYLLHYHSLYIRNINLTS